MIPKPSLFPLSQFRPPLLLQSSWGVPIPHLLQQWPKIPGIWKYKPWGLRQQPAGAAELGLSFPHPTHHYSYLCCPCSSLAHPHPLHSKGYTQLGDFTQALRWLEAFHMICTECFALSLVLQTLGLGHSLSPSQGPL